jgi:hypothetical protein
MPERSDEGEVIRDFLELIMRTKKNTPILFILTKFDLVNQKYSDDYVQAAKGIYPGPMKLLYSYDKSRVLPFSVGLIDKTDKTKFLDNSSQYVKEILSWFDSL